MLLVPPSPSIIRARSSGLSVADVFSVDSWTGNATDDRNITNGVDLSGNGGAVWIKNQDATDSHIIVDSERGPTKYLSSNGTSGEATDANMVQAFNSNGFQIGTANAVNTNAEDYIAWTIRKATGFFDCLTYTSNGSNRTIPHNLGTVPGMIIIKMITDSGFGWQVYHRSNTANPETDVLQLNGTGATFDDIGYWNDTAPTDSVFSLGTSSNVNWSTVKTYVAYLFAHDADGLIQCGGYTGNGSATGPSISLGWEPQFVMIKNTSNTGNWMMFDNVRGMTTGVDGYITANTSNENFTSEFIQSSATGFDLKSDDASINANNDNYVYMTVKAA